MKAVHLFRVIPFLLPIASGEVFAQSTVDTKVQALEETVRNLERRVATLEGQLRERAAPAPVPAGKESWRKLKKGMSASDVERLLGSPSTVDEYGVMTVWHYGQGRVRFDGNTGTVDAWFEP